MAYSGVELVMFKVASWMGYSLSVAVFTASVAVVGMERAIAEVAFSINDRQILHYHLYLS